MWKPVSFKTIRRPALSGARLGQISQSVVNQAARSVVVEAEPRLRAVIRDERQQFADAGKSALPFLALSAAGFVGTSFFVKSTKGRLLGYGASALMLGVGLWTAFDIYAGSGEPTPPAEAGVDIPFVGDVGRQLARSVVAEAEPAIRGIVQDERKILSEAAGSTLPWFAGATASLVGTAFLVPEDIKWGKAVGYTTSALLALFGVYQGLETTAA